MSDASLAMIAERIPGSPVSRGRLSSLQNEPAKEFGARDAVRMRRDLEASITYLNCGSLLYGKRFEQKTCLNKNPGLASPSNLPMSLGFEEGPSVA
jgi:hypothetical protein